MSGKTWKISDIGKFLKNSFVAILKGEFFLRMNAGRYLVHIAYTFFLFGMIIWISLMIETTMAKVERNKEELKELQIANSQKTFDVVSLSRRSAVEETLGKLGSEVKEAENPAFVLEK